jgi:hypothetical protein
MYAERKAGVLEYMNCSHPWHAAGTAAPLQAGTLLVLSKKVFALSWSEKMLATPETGLVQLEPNVVPVSLVMPVTVSKEPIAWDMTPVGAWAETSLPLPTAFMGREPNRGPCGLGGGVVHGTSRQSVFG